MTPKEHAISLLSQGIPPGQVAASCGVDPSYISQLSADPNVQAQIAAARADRAVEDVSFDSTLEKAERMALDKIEQNMRFATIGQALAAFRVLNGARRRKDAFAQPNEGLTVNVNLTLPAMAVPQYIANDRNEIVEVDGQTLVSATAESLDQLLAKRAIAKMLPKTSEIEKAATLLDNLQAAKLKPVASKLPAEISPDIL